MIVPSKNLINFIKSFEDRDSFCEKFEISQATLSKYMNEEISCSSDFIEKVVRTGLDFEKSFEVK